MVGHWRIHVESNGNQRYLDNRKGIRDQHEIKKVTVRLITYIKLDTYT
jgi:hypothetical protein